MVTEPGPLTTVPLPLPVPLLGHTVVTALNAPVLDEQVPELVQEGFK